ncbi:MAG TPA: hypothetical protein VFK13_01455 [Gemmatimonadaceae bacterium]|nr:hypothetical protein [Gemmatimonadaceae bacterium]
MFVLSLALAALGPVCGSTPTSVQATSRPVPSVDHPPAAQVVVDSARHEIVVTMGPFRVPAMAAHDGGHGPMAMSEMSHAEHAMMMPGQSGNMNDHAAMSHGAMTRATGSGMASEHMNMPSTQIFCFPWPVEGWMRGFRISVRDASGAQLPRTLLHHVIGVNFDRRQLLYPVAERLIGTGTETPDIELPRSVAVPMTEGQELGLYAMWHNETGKDIDGAYIRVAILWMPQDAGHPPIPVLPLYADVNFHVAATNAFDVPPGRSEHSFEFTLPVSGHLLAISGHLHDYGTGVRLEDAETGKVIASVRSTLDADGHIEGIEKKIFIVRGKKLEAHHRYRVVGEYVNPTDDTLRLSAMAHMVGLFAPDAMAQWPKLDRNAADYRMDVAALFDPSRMNGGMEGADGDAEGPTVHQHEDAGSGGAP